METLPAAVHEKRSGPTFAFALHQLAFDIMRAGVDTVPIATRYRSTEHATPGAAQASNLDARDACGWVLVPARAPEGRYERKLIPGYAFTASGKLVPFLPAETHDRLVVVGEPIDPATVDELWLARQTDNLLGYWDQGQGYWNQGRQVPGRINDPDYLTWGFDYQPAEPAFPAS